MKRVFVWIWISLTGLPALLWGQIPEQKNRALVYKTTATWCYPCGTWGWDLANALHADLGDEMIYLALFNSSNGTYNNSAFYNAVAVTLAFNFRYSSWPSFGVNGYNLTDINNNQAAAIRQAIEDSVSAFNSKPVIANAASLISIDDATGQMEVGTKAEFFKATEGDYYLATYLVEEGAVNQQYGQSGLVEHKGVLRVALDSLDWGALIASGSIDSGYTVSKTYHYTVTDADWDLSKLVVCNIIWKKVGTKYEYVNGSKHRPGSTAIQPGAAAQQPRLRVYPNPATSIVHLELEGVNGPFTILVTDVLGGKVIRQTQPARDTRSLSLEVRHWPKGLYLLQLCQKNLSVQRKLWVR